MKSSLELTKLSKFSKVLEVASEADLEEISHIEESLLNNPKIAKEVRWHLKVLKEASDQIQLKEAEEGIRNALSQIFSSSSKGEDVLGRLKEISEVRAEGGKPMELKRFVGSREPKVLAELQYRHLLSLKIVNTEAQVNNMMEMYPEVEDKLAPLLKKIKEIHHHIDKNTTPTQEIKAEEEALRESDTFRLYEELKNRSLKGWVDQFSSDLPELFQSKSTEEIQQMILEHKRHVMTTLLDSSIILSEREVSARLGVHDTLECNFSNDKFWTGANLATKKGFRSWILSVIHSFGMIKGQRFALFESKDFPGHYLLFGAGVPAIPENENEPFELVPYIKPLVEKEGELLEIRHREINDEKQYNYELSHYTLPFLFAFDKMPHFELAKELISFFTSKY